MIINGSNREGSSFVAIDIAIWIAWTILMSMSMELQQNWNHHVGIAISIAIEISRTIPMSMAMATKLEPSLILLALESVQQKEDLHPD